MKTGEQGIALIKEFEKCHLEAYICPAGRWTIGWGHTGKVNGKPICKGMKITQKKADSLLATDLKKFEAEVKKYPKYLWTQNEFDAMVSFCYNVGTINQLTDFGTRSKTVIAQKMLLYNKANGISLAGLTRRRKDEQTLFLTKGK
jgi:GH24 family phage-related lysozyme (muramidase)